MGTKIQARRDSAVNWALNNPVLNQGEFGYDTTNKLYKIGDGANTWEDLLEFNPGSLFYMGTWDASSGSYPTSPEKGWYYTISIAGTISGTAYVADDWIVYNGLAWNKVNNQVYQPLDSTLTTLSNLTTAADKMIYFTASDTATTGTITSLGRSLIGETTASAIRDLIESTSSTIATMSILVYDGTPSESDLSTYDEIYTTPALCFAALPAIINHAVTIKIRKADGSAYAAATLQRVVSAGSITIQGEYYYNNTVASAGSGTGKFNVIAGHSELVQAGDKVLLMKYSGTVGASTPSDAFVDTIASVSGTEITLTTRTSDAFDTSWRYVIVRTAVVGININATKNVEICGLIYNEGTNPYISNSSPVFRSCIIPVYFIDTHSKVYAEYSAFKRDYSGDNGFVWYMFDNCIGIFYNCAFLNAGNNTGTAITAIRVCNLTLLWSIIKNIGNGQAGGIRVDDNSAANISLTTIDGVSATYKMVYGIRAERGGSVACWATFGDNITTQKIPANWAATTDGSYVS